MLNVEETKIYTDWYAALRSGSSFKNRGAYTSGDKSSQSRDIAVAMKLARDWVQEDYDGA